MRQSVQSLQQWIPIEKNDTLTHLYKLAFIMSYEATNEALQKIRFNDFSNASQSKTLQKSYFSYPKREDWKSFRKNGGRFI